MKIGVCVSNEKLKFEKFPMKLLQKLFNKSTPDWSNKFIEVLELYKLDYCKIFIDKDDWINMVKQCDVLIWKPKFMGPMSSSFFKEKVFFIQYVLGKRIYPNFETIWHFDSKIAQKYIFDNSNIKTPKTYVIFDYNEAISKSMTIKYPIVLKKSNGAGSANVKLIKNKIQFQKVIIKEFIFRRIMANILKFGIDPFGYVYFQEFIKDNKRDLRINIIGDRYAVGFWRENRRNDFRASGSGKIDYTREIPKEVIEYCARISKENKFDSMAYDVLFKDGDFVIIEMSYGFVDKAFYNASGYYELDEDGRVSNFIARNTWPQELWIKWLKDNHYKI